MGTSDETEDTEGPAASAEPFMRSDDAAGSAYELTKLTVLGLTLAPLRLILWVATVLPMYAACRLIYCVGLPLGCVRAIGRAMARLTLVLLGFWPCCGIRRSGLDGQSPAQWASGAVLVVSNHVSWLDILFLMSEDYSPSFVAKAGFLKAPMIGWFAGTLFDCVAVDNSAEVAAAAAAVGKDPQPSLGGGTRPSTAAGGATAAITARLGELMAGASGAPGAQQRPPLAVFAEGTTSNGQFLINFRTGVFRAAAATMVRDDGSAPVHCMVLRYPHRRFSPAWESIFVTTHLLRLLTQFSSTLQVDYLPPVELRDVLRRDGGDAITEESAAELAVTTRRYMSARASIPTFEAGAKEKAGFHAWLGPRMVALTARERLIYTHPPARSRK